MEKRPRTRTLKSSKIRAINFSKYRLKSILNLVVVLSLVIGLKSVGAVTYMNGVCPVLTDNPWEPDM